MEIENIHQKIHAIVNVGNRLKNNYTKEEKAVLDSCYIFAQTKEEYDELEEYTKEVGRLLSATPTGNIYQIPPIETECGILRILKIRIPDDKATEMGCADFALEDYDKFKEEYITRKNFTLIQRVGYEMIELIDKAYNARVYFPNPPQEKKFQLR